MSFKLASYGRKSALLFPSPRESPTSNYMKKYDFSQSPHKGNQLIIQIYTTFLIIHIYIMYKTYFITSAEAIFQFKTYLKTLLKFIRILNKY